MSYAPALPSFPCLPQPDRAVMVEPFVNESAIAPLLHSPAIAWREKQYIGEDFAGLEEYAVFLPQSPHDAAPARPKDDASAFPESPGVNMHLAGSTPLAASMWKNAMAMGSAAAIVIAAALGGLWAAHATKPAGSGGGHDKSLGSHPHLSAMTHPR